MKETSRSPPWLSYSYLFPHPLPRPPAHLMQPVHYPAARVSGHLAQAAGVHAPAHPLGRGQHQRWSRCPARGQGERHVPRCSHVARSSLSDEARPGRIFRILSGTRQLIKHLRPAGRAGAGKGQLSFRRYGERIARFQQPVAATRSGALPRTLPAWSSRPKL